MGFPVASSSFFYDIRPLLDVEYYSENKNTWIATSKQPWMELSADLNKIVGNSIEFFYEASILDCLTRPIIRFILNGLVVDHILPAPVGGRGAWTGYVPHGVRQIQISPVDAPGPFGFRIVGCNLVGKWQKTQRALKHHPLSISWAAVQRVTGYPDKARRRLQRAWGATPLNAHQNWLTSRTRALEWNGLDAPRTTEAPHLRVALLDATAEQEAKVVGVLAGQPRSEWSTVCASSSTTIEQLTENLHPNDFLIVLNSGDAITTEAPAIFAEMYARNPADLYFTDELDADQGGTTLQAGLESHPLAEHRYFWGGLASIVLAGRESAWANGWLGHFGQYLCLLTIRLFISSGYWCLVGLCHDSAPHLHRR